MLFRSQLGGAVACLLLAPVAANAQTGAPDDLSFLSVSQPILDTVDRQLPERSAIGADFLDSAYSPNLYFSEDAQIGITFVSEGAGYRNAIGYFTYETGAFDGLSFSDIDLDRSGVVSASEIRNLSGVGDVDILFSNFSASGSGGVLSAGDTAVIGGGTASFDLDGSVLVEGGTVFEAGTNLGFFLSANAWNGSDVNGWDNNRSVDTYWSLDFLNPEAGANATIDSAPTSSRHFAALNVAETGDIIIGVEDLNRYSGDNDFNDAVFLINATPTNALDDSPIPTVSVAPGPGVGAVSILASSAAMAFGAFPIRARRRSEKRDRLRNA